MKIPLTHVSIHFDEDVVIARNRAKDIVKLIGLPLQNQTKFVTAVSEIVRNAFQYAGNATVKFQINFKNARNFIEAVVEDNGPGIENIDEILSGRYKSKSGMGLGILGTKKIVDYFKIETTPGKGTKVTIGELLPDTIKVDTKTVSQWRESLIKKSPSSSYEELLMHNQELMELIEEINRKDKQLQEQLERLELLNRELEQTNEGMIALHSELEKKNKLLEEKNRQLIKEIEDRRKIEKKLRESEELYRSVVENVHDGIMLLRDRKIIFANRGCENIFNLPVDKVIGRDFSEFVTSEDKNLLDKTFIKGDRNECVLDGCEFRVLNIKGEVISVELRVREMKIKDGNTHLLVLRDIRTRKMLEEERLKTSKLESIGILAGGIAHDFNNLLTVILGNITLSKLKLGEDHEVVQFLNDAEKASLMAKDLAYKFLTFSSGSPPIQKVENVKDAIKDTVRVTFSGSNIKTEVKIPDNLWNVYCDITQFQQALTNVLINAKEAMPNGGTIEITAENIEVSSLEMPVLPSGKYVKITVKDEGCGISEENLQKVFDPYFSTKERSTQKGMGLGLTITYSIVKNHGGNIEIKSKEGEGTTVVMYFPAVEVMQKKTEEEKLEIKKGRGRILVMDDEPLVRGAVRNMLETLGYTVELASDGNEAVKLYKKTLDRGKPYDLVILDITVPGGIGGREALLELKSLDPDVKAIVSSGYSNDPIMAHYKNYGFAGVVSKPYKIEEVSRIISEILDQN